VKLEQVFGKQKGNFQKHAVWTFKVMVLEQLAFGLFALVTLASSLGVVLVRDVWHAALLLGLALSSVAVHYIMLSAEFLAVIQILVYIGGVLVLLTFGVMLTRDQDADGREVGA
jgi:NADH-quinone oxidoreductase subunit J